MATTNLSSGLTAKATSDNNAVELIAATDVYVNQVRIVNTSAVAGFYSTDGGSTWFYLPASVILDDDVSIRNKAIQMKRVTDGSDVTGVWASAWRREEK